MPEREERRRGRELCIFAEGQQSFFLALHPLAGCFRALLTNIVTKVGRGKKFPTRTKAIISYVTACERGRERERRSLENRRGPLVCCASTTNLFSRGLEWLTDPTNWARIMVGFFFELMTWKQNPSTFLQHPFAMNETSMMTFLQRNFTTNEVFFDWIEFYTVLSCMTKKWQRYMMKSAASAAFTNLKTNLRKLYLYMEKTICSCLSFSAIYESHVQPRCLVWKFRLMFRTLLMPDISVSFETFVPDNSQSFNLQRTLRIVCTIFIPFGIFRVEW